MEEKIKHYQELLKSPAGNENEDFGYVPERVKMILKELRVERKDDIFESQNFSQVLGVSSVSFSNFLTNKAGTNFRIVFKIIHFFSLMGYNPLWIINRNNMLLSKKHVESEFTMNKNTVDSAYNVLVDKIKKSQEDVVLALDNFKGTITS